MRGMVLLGAAVLFLTVALVEANPFGGDLALWLSLMQAAILLGVAFVWWERRAPNPMITPALIANKQFRNANLGMLFFGAGAIGTPAAALARVHQPVGLLADRGGVRARAGAAMRPARVAVRRRASPTPSAPGEIARPALIVMAIGMLWVSFLPSTAARRLDLHPHPARPDDDRGGHGDRLPGAQRRRDGGGRRAGGRARVGHPQHRAPAGRGDRRGDPDRDLRRRAARAHVVVRRRRDRGHRRRLGHAGADGQRRSSSRRCTTTPAAPRSASSPSRASTRTSSARPPARPARATPGRSGRPRS